MRLRAYPSAKRVVYCATDQCDQLVFVEIGDAFPVHRHLARANVIACINLPWSSKQLEHSGVTGPTRPWSSARSAEPQRSPHMMQR
jgi:hypothetical protein